MRERLGCPQAAPVGVYVGKFGGLYYDEEAFDIFKTAADHFGPEFRLIILTSEGEVETKKRLAAVGIAATRSYVAQVSHHEVASFLLNGQLGVCHG